MPKILERAVSQIKARGVPESKAYAIATASMQKAGNLKKGTNQATEKGKRRGEMTHAARAKDRAAKTYGGKSSDYKYNGNNNSAVKGRVNPKVKKRK